MKTIITIFLFLVCTHNLSGQNGNYVGTYIGEVQSESGLFTECDKINLKDSGV